MPATPSKPVPLKITGERSDGSLFEKRLTSRVRDVIIDEPHLRTLDLTAVASLPALRKLWVTSKTLTAIDLGPIAGLPIERLGLVMSELQALDLAPLARSHALQDLVFCTGNRTVDLAPLANCKALTMFSYFQAALEQVDLTPLTGCMALEVIWLNDTQLTTLDLAPLARLPRLCSFNLPRCRLKQVSLGSTPGFPALEYLIVNHNPLTSLDLTALTGSMRMREVAVSSPLQATLDTSPLAGNRRFKVNLKD